MAEKKKVVAVRKAAAALADAIGEARAAGFVVDYPSRVEGLHTIVISETGRVTEDGEDADTLAATNVGTTEVPTRPAT